MQRWRFILLINLAVFVPFCSHAQTYSFPWLPAVDSSATVADIPAPSGCARVPTSANTFADWLRHLPLKTASQIVLLHTGRPKPNQSAHHSILNIDVGTENLQQCADAIMRLRAEFWWSQRRFDAVAFNFTSGQRAAFDKWAQGYRPSVRGKDAIWRLTAAADSSYENFREYLRTVFIYAGSASLNQEMKRVAEVKDLRSGDVFIQGGYPGHAVIVVDVAVEPDSGKKLFLLAQSYMPAQEIHVLKNPQDGILSPWYEIQATDRLYTPEWAFKWTDLKRFRDPE